jgi:uncharacterized membrane protein
MPIRPELRLFYRTPRRVPRQLRSLIAILLLTVANILLATITVHTVHSANQRARELNRRFEQLEAELAVAQKICQER